MYHWDSIDRFIACLARKINNIYPSNCADTCDYIQVGYLKLAEITNGEFDQKNFKAYAISSIARAMRRAAVDSTCSVSAPHRTKEYIHRIRVLSNIGKTEQEICSELRITKKRFDSLKPLTVSKSLNEIFEEPTNNAEEFSIIDDILSSDGLTNDDKSFISAQFNGTVSELGLSRKSKWKRAKNMRDKLRRSGYGS